MEDGNPPPNDAPPPAAPPIDLGKLARESGSDERPQTVSGWPPPDAEDTGKQGRSTFNPAYDAMDHPTPAVQLAPMGLGCARIAVGVPLLVGWIRKRVTRR